MFCKNCGNAIDNNDTFCNKCGKKLIEDNESDYKDSIGKAAVILALISIFINPFAILSVLSIIFGAISWSNVAKYGGNSKDGRNAVVYGIITLVLQLILMNLVFG